MKKNFWTGVLAGVCGVLILIVIAGFLLSFTLTGSSIGKVFKMGTTDKNSVQSEDIPYDKVVSKLNFLQKLVDDYYLKNVKDVSFEDGVYKGFIASLQDPYSVYYTKDEYNALMESSSGVYCGIGATVSQDAKTGVITIVKPFSTGPAYKVGVLPGDVLYKVDDDSVAGLDLTQVVGKMKGEEGTKVRVSVVREGKSEPIEYTITRQKIEIPTIEYKMLDNKIGYIMIAEFDEITVEQFVKAVDQLEKEGMEGLVLDVRNNPGGLLTSVVKILDRLLPPELIVYTEDKAGNREDEKAVDKKQVTLPMAVLINGQSASASEIFAGALQDYETATIIGTTSFGKGIVQKVIPLSDGTAVKLTISKYFTPKGRNIHGTGIEPDLEVELNSDVQKTVVIPVEKDNQLKAAIKHIEKQIK